MKSKKGRIWPSARGKLGILELFAGYARETQERERFGNKNGRSLWESTTERS